MNGLFLNWDSWGVSLILQLVLVMGDRSMDAVQTSEGAVFTEDTQSLMQSWTKWCKADGNADEAEIFSRFFASSSEKLIEFSLEIVIGPISLFDFC